MGLTLAYMVADLDGPVDHRGICVGIHCSRTGKELDKSASWHWLGLVRDGAVSIHLWLVDPP